MWEGRVRVRCGAGRVGGVRDPGPRSEDRARFGPIPARPIWPLVRIENIYKRIIYKYIHINIYIYIFGDASSRPPVERARQSRLISAGVLGRRNILCI